MTFEYTPKCYDEKGDKSKLHTVSTEDSTVKNDNNGGN